VDVSGGLIVIVALDLETEPVADPSVALEILFIFVIRGILVKSVARAVWKHAAAIRAADEKDIFNDIFTPWSIKQSSYHWWSNF
jgi:hypothetical protein